MKANEIKDKFDIDLAFTSYVDGENTFESWAKVLTAKALEKLARGANRHCFRGGADDYLRKMDNRSRFWTDAQNYVDCPMTGRYKWMEYNGWLRVKYTKGTPMTPEDREIFHHLGLVKDGWQRLTDNGIVNKTWEDEEWY